MSLLLILSLVKEIGQTGEHETPAQTYNDLKVSQQQNPYTLGRVGISVKEELEK